MYRIRADENILLYLWMSPQASLYSSLRTFSGMGSGANPSEISFPFFQAFSDTLSNLFFDCSKLLLGEGSNAVKPFYGYIKYLKALFQKMLRQYITKGTIFEMGSGAKPQQKFLTLHIEIIRTLRHIFVKCFNFISI